MLWQAVFQQVGEQAGQNSGDMLECGSISTRESISDIMPRSIFGMFMNKPLVFLGIFTLVIIALGFTGQWVNEYLSYDRHALLSGELWRVLTAHLVHSNVYHTFMNLGILAVSVFLFGKCTHVSGWLVVFVSLCLLDSLGLFVFSSHVVNYVGMSGVLYGILSFGLLKDIKKGKWINGITLLLLAGKIIWEQLPGYDVNYLRSKIDAAVIVDAHLYGYIGGIVLYLIFIVFTKIRGAKGYG